ncbi:MAG: TolC family protein [Bacteroidaceae bacterium]|jgi:outer membrane protein TolC
MLRFKHTVSLLLALHLTTAGHAAVPEDSSAVREWTLEEIIDRACTCSPDALSARHTFRAAYWDWRAYKANYLPALTLTSSPNLNRAINEVTMGDGSVRFVEQNLLTSDLTLQLTQRVAWTGGTISLESSLQRLDLFSDGSASWKSIPANISYSQSLFGYNSMKWERRTEPLRYEEAQKSYLETMELVAAQAVDYFFALANAQSNYETACQNYANADTLYHFARGRYEIGTITENEMLQLEINRLNEETNRLDALTEMEEATLTLCSYLGFPEGEGPQKVRIGTELPELTVDPGHALLWAHAQSPDIVSLKRQQIEAESYVAQAKANAGFKADLYLRFGLTQTSDGPLGEAYHHLLDQQIVSVGFTLPILDWGRGRGQVRVAQSQRDLVNTQVAQHYTDFDQNIRKIVGQFNLQSRRVFVAGRTDSTAQRRSDVARRLYLLGRSSVLDLNASISEKDEARRNFINALHTYWSLYYTLRSLTLYDFQNGRPLRADYEALREYNDESPGGKP